MTYTQLTQEQRYQIDALLKMEHSQFQIATALGVHKSTISRELRRNRGKRGYRPKQAHHFALKRRINSVTKRITAEIWSRIEQNSLLIAAGQVVTNHRFTGTTGTRNDQQRHIQERMLVTALWTDHKRASWINDLINPI
jgi:IS30 family transposase